MSRRKVTTYKNPSAVSGLSINDIMDMDITQFNALNEKQLKQVATRLVSAGNKRLARMSKAGISTPASRVVMNSGGKFSVAGKNLNQTRAEFIRLKQFLKSETGTIAGYKKVRKKVIEGARKKGGVNITEKQYDKLWKAYEELKNVDPTVKIKEYKYKVLGEITEEMENNPSKDVEEMVLDMIERISEIYEEHEQRTSEDSNSVSKFFEF